MVTFRSSVRKRFVDAVENNAVDVIRNVHEAVYLTAHQQLLYIEGRLASAIREEVPHGNLAVEVTVKPSAYELGVTKYEVVANHEDEDYLTTHCLRILVDANYLIPNTETKGTSYKLVERSSQPMVEFERIVHRLASDIYDDILGDTTLSSQECIVMWEDRMVAGLKRMYRRDTFGAELTMKHGVHGVTFVGFVTDLENSYQVSVDVDMNVAEDPKRVNFTAVDNKPPAEVIISLDPETEHQKKAIQSKLTSSGTAALVESFLKLESQLPAEEALTEMADWIKREITVMHDDLKVKVSVGYYHPQNSVTVAIVELNSSVGISLLAKRK